MVKRFSGPLGNGPDWTLPNLSRRDTLLLFSALAASGTLSRWIPPAMAQPTTPGIIRPKSLIDVHAHIFNAQDIPIEGFVVDVIGKSNFWLRLADSVGFLGLVADILTGGGKSYTQEMSRLWQMKAENLAVGDMVDAKSKDQEFLNDRIQGLVPATVDPKVSGRGSADTLQVASAYFDPKPLPFADDADPLEIVNALDTQRPEIRARAINYLYKTYLPGQRDQLRKQQEEQYRDTIPQDVQKKLRGEPVAMADGFELDTAQVKAADDVRRSITEPLKPVPAEIVEGKTEEASTLAWAAQFNRYRVELAHYLSSKFRNVPEAPKFYAVSMVDYRFWLGKREETPTRIEDQAALVARISELRPNGKLFHGFYPFDPLRALVQEKENLPKDRHALEVAKRAVKTQGFLGVKVYPPMGFFAIGNSGVADFGPRAAQTVKELKQRGIVIVNLGADLDRKLRELYDWCIEEDVPILAHCSPTQFSFEAASQRARPDNWKMLLDMPNYKNLRLNIGHFGGPWCLGKTAQTQDQLSGAACDVITANESLTFLTEKTWTGKVVKMLNAADSAYPNLYADIADSSAVSNPDQKNQWEASYTNLKTLLKANTKAAARLMYGTDWPFLGREKGYDSYYLAMLDQMNRLMREMPELGQGFIDSYFWKSSAQFMGLIARTPGGPKPKTRLRLDEFHKGRPEAIDILASFDRLAAT